MSLEILHYPAPMLRAKGERIEKITPALQQLAHDMLETMRAANGVGLAAQQVGHTIQLTVLDVPEDEERPSRMWIDGEETDFTRHMPMILINPQIQTSGKRFPGTEGCLSFPEISAEIMRPERVEVEALDIHGEPLRFEAEGLLGRALQHEVDHLHGVLFIDRMSAAAKASVAGRLKRLRKQAA